jgi:hypothetical protein
VEIAVVLFEKYKRMLFGFHSRNWNAVARIVLQL